MRPAKAESSGSLQQLLDDLRRHRDQLRSLGRPVDSWDDWLVLFVSEAMDPATRREWEEEIESLDASSQREQPFIPSFATCSAFLQRKCRTLRSIEESRDKHSRLLPRWRKEVEVRTFLPLLRRVAVSARMPMFPPVVLTSRNAHSWSAGTLLPASDCAITVSGVAMLIGPVHRPLSAPSASARMTLCFMDAPRKDPVHLPTSTLLQRG